MTMTMLMKEVQNERKKKIWMWQFWPLYFGNYHRFFLSPWLGFFGSLLKMMVSQVRFLGLEYFSQFGSVPKCKYFGLSRVASRFKNLGLGWVSINETQSKSTCNPMNIKAHTLNHFQTFLLWCEQVFNLEWLLNSMEPYVSNSLLNWKMAKVWENILILILSIMALHKFMNFCVIQMFYRNFEPTITSLLFGVPLWWSPLFKLNDQYEAISMIDLKHWIVLSNWYACMNFICLLNCFSCLEVLENFKVFNQIKHHEFLRITCCSQSLTASGACW